MKEYFALLNEKGQIGAVASARKNSYRNMAAKVTFNEFQTTDDAREIFRDYVRKGWGVSISGREARVYARLLREKEALVERLEKITLELGVR